MPKTLLDLAQAMRNLKGAIAKSVNQYVIDYSFRILTHLEEKTPVDTSRAISNWIVTPGAPSNYSLLPYYHGSHGSTRDSSMLVALASGQYEAKLKKPGEPLFITNNVDYILDLEGGSSQQAPQGFLDESLLQARLEQKPFKLMY